MITMTKIQLSLITKAVNIRVTRGEDIDSVLSSYTKLTDEERASIKEALA